MAYIRTPFASSGDKTAIPNDAQPDGSVSQTEGFGVDYQLDPGSDPSALNVPRRGFNEIIYDTQFAIQQIQQKGFPLHITAADNGGSAYAYAINSTVRATDGNNYYSLINGNTDVPPSSNWAQVIYSSTTAPGSIELWGFSTIKSGYVWLNGTTIGDGSSGATGRANADTATIFAMLWADYSNTVLPIQTSAGAASTRGANAAADFAAHKRLPTPDYRGRSFFGKDDMGGASAAGRVTNALSGIAGTTLGASGGLETVQLTANQNGTHAHTGTTNSDGTHTHTASNDSAGTHTHTGTASAADANATFYGQSVANAGSSGSKADYLALRGLGLDATNYIGNGLAASTTDSTLVATGNHAHTLSTNSAGLHTHNITVDSAGAHTHAFTTGNSGLGSDHQNMPPAMIGGGFIMKL
jgi:microcystin-dependent protein